MNSPLHNYNKIEETDVLVRLRAEQQLEAVVGIGVNISASCVHDVPILLVSLINIACKGNDFQ